MIYTGPATLIQDGNELELPEVELAIEAEPVADVGILRSWHGEADFPEHIWINGGAAKIRMPDGREGEIHITERRTQGGITPDSIAFVGKGKAPFGGED